MDTRDIKLFLSLISFDWVNSCHEPEWNYIPKYWCEGHEQVYWDIHIINAHPQCKTDLIPECNYIRECFKQTNSLIEALHRKGSDHTLDSRYPGYNSEVNEYDIELKNLIDWTSSIFRLKDIPSIGLITPLIDKFYKKVDNSLAKSHLANFLFNRSLTDNFDEHLEEFKQSEVHREERKWQHTLITQLQNSHSQQVTQIREEYEQMLKTQKQQAKINLAKTKGEYIKEFKIKRKYYENTIKNL